MVKKKIRTGNRKTLTNLNQFKPKNEKDHEPNPERQAFRKLLDKNAGGEPDLKTLRQFFANRH
ncbi:MAG: hypothetical protein ABSH48_23995 [Verrucomicrobiota bacterium]